MSEMKTASDLRVFLAEVLTDIRDGKVTPEKAGAISKVASQINQSLAIEVSAALQLRRLNERASEVSLSIEKKNVFPLPDNREVWCEQCEGRVSVGDAKACKSKFCKATELLGG